MSKIEEIKNLKSLLDQGAITQDEFTELKKSVLGISNGESVSRPGFNNRKLEIPKENIKPTFVSDHPKMNDTNIPQIPTPSFFNAKFIKYAIGIAIIGLLSYIGNNTSTDNSGSNCAPIESGNDRAVLYCNFCQKTIVEENGKGIICYTNEPDGCAVVQFYSGYKAAFCSPECCRSWRIAMGK